ncbi:M50 family metallopeptidase [Deinococcus fonticola]|uniref:M50 family metallopeptidase n=1 Tax=Deinococcus fonticola TaxID=2528713 RepID=UPI001074FCC2|nr:M50 family metallopeptidase [Deinococcus fonticola]
MNFFQSLAAVLTPTGLLWTVIILGIATFLHELAHYALARWQGVPVKSFSVGMGPVLLSRRWKGTEWRVSALPLGGYVEIDGMAPVPGADGQMQAPTSGYAGLPSLGKIAVILAGPVMNLALALGLMTLLFTNQGLPVPDRVRIEEVVANSTAQNIGLKKGDVITAIDGQDIPQLITVNGKQLPGWQSVPEILKKNGPHTFTLQRSGVPGPVQVVFDWTPSVGGKKQLLGIRYSPDVQKVGAAQAFGASVSNTVQAVPQVLSAFGNLFKRFLTLDLSQDQGVSGPIGTAEIVSRAAALGPWALVEIAIMLNLSLAFFNLIPIPGLDGGRILLTLIGAIKGSPLSFAQENAINFAGFAFVMMLMLFVILRDASRFF